MIDLLTVTEASSELDLLSALDLALVDSISWSGTLERLSYLS